MTKKLIIPTRILPAVASHPGRPWHSLAAPPPPPAASPLPDPPDPQPQPVEVRHVHEIIVTSPDPEPQPEPSRRERLAGWLGGYARPWHAAAALAGAVVPIPGVGYSAATIWHYTVGYGRDEWGIGWGYALGGIPLALALNTVVRRGGSPLRLFALVVTGIGALAALSWYDPIQWLTGVHR